MVKNRRKAKKFANRIDPVLSDDVDIHDEKSEKGQEGFCKQDRPFLGDEKHDQAIWDRALLPDKPKFQNLRYGSFAG